MECFILLRGKGKAAAFGDWFLNLPLGGINVGFITCRREFLRLTLIGWGLLIKGLIRFCAVKLTSRMFAEVSLERSSEVQVADAGLVALGLPPFGHAVLLSSGRA